MSEPMTKVTREELRSALRTTKTRRDHRFPLSNGWFVTAQRIYPQPARIGPAWFFLFHIESPTGKRFGGRTNVAEMVAFFCNPRAWQWRDAYVDIHLTQKQREWRGTGKQRAAERRAHGTVSKGRSFRRAITG